MSKIRIIFDEIKSIFLNGLFTLLPITFTFILFRTTFRIISSWLQPIKNIEPEFLRKIPYAEFLFVFLFILLVGVILKFFILDKIIIAIEESIFFRIPILKTVYSGTKQLVHGLTTQDKLSFNKVVLVEFPNRGTYSIGFLTGEFPRAISPNLQEIYYSIFIPTTPNPTTGFFVIVPKEEIRETDLSKQEAMSIIISGGIVKPDRFK